MAQQPTLKAGKHAGKVERLEARVTRQQKRIIERAAELRGTSVTDFVVASAQHAAAEIIQELEMISLRGKGSEAFVKALLDPPAPNAAAKAAAGRYQESMRR